MKIISHRGNIDGPDKNLENNPDHIQSLLNQQQDVEIDVWFYKENYYLGHDEPIFKIEKLWLSQNLLWCHAKNIESMNKLLEDRIHCFWHENDRLTLTSNSIPWCYPNTWIKNGITVVLKKQINLPKHILGICTDYINYYKEKI
jgi:hypothetical protein